MTDLLARQLALYPSIALLAGQRLIFVDSNYSSVLVLQNVDAVLHSWPAPLAWGQVLDYLFNQHETNHILAPIHLSKNMIFDPQRSSLQLGNAITKLTDKEHATLLYLYHAARPVTREELIEKVWGYHTDVQTHTVETLIWRLRQKLETNPEVPELLITTAQGYALNH